MGKIYITLIGFLGWLLCAQEVLAQCPGQEQIIVKASDESSFQREQGRLIITVQGTAPIVEGQYRIRLWDSNKQRYVYDDNNPPFLNITQLEIENNTISFDKLPDGQYALELHGEACNYFRYDVGRVAKVITK